MIKYIPYLFLFLFLLSCVTTQPLILKLPNVPETTTNAQEIIRETNEPSQEFYPKISPDGKSLLYSAIETEKVEPIKPLFNDLFATTSVRVNKVKGAGTIVKKEVGSQIRSPLVQDAKDAIWAPDGSGIIFSYRKPIQPVIVKTNLNGAGLNYVSADPMGSNDSEPNITNDGKKVIFSTMVGSKQMICSMNMKGGDFTVITEGKNVSLNPSDNNQIIYNLLMNGGSQIITLNLKTGQKTQLTSGNYDYINGAFSNDGRWIAYCSNQENPSTSKFHIYIMRSDGTEVKQLTMGDTNEGDPCWGIDNWVFFYSNAGNNYNIWKVKPRF